MIEGEDMKCTVCNKEIVSGVNHVCIEEKYIKSNVKPNFVQPDFNRSEKSASYHGIALAISPNPPKDLTLEDIKNFKSSHSGFIHELIKSGKVVIKTIKHPSKENIRILVISLVFFIIWFWTKYMPGGFNYMMPGGIKSVFAVLFGTFNNVPARVLHFSSILTLLTSFLPIISQPKRTFMGNLKSSVAVIRPIVKDVKSKSFSVFIMAFGLGLFTSNFLMRNNSSNKYMVCLSLGMTMILSTSGMFNTTFVKLSKSFFYDLSRLLRFESFLNKYQIVLQAGIGIALISSYLICLIHGMFYFGFVDALGYILGTGIFIFGTFRLVTSK